MITIIHDHPLGKCSCTLLQDTNDNIAFQPSPHISFRSPAQATKPDRYCVDLEVFLGQVYKLIYCRLHRSPCPISLRCLLITIIMKYQG
jgi:hypothetical protein